MIIITITITMIIMQAFGKVGLIGRIWADNVVKAKGTGDQGIECFKQQYICFCGFIMLICLAKISFYNYCQPTPLNCFLPVVQ